MFRKLKTKELIRLTTYQYKNAEKWPVILILDNIRSMHNVGSIFRTADSFGVESIFLCGITAKPPHTEIHKSAIGAEYSVPWEYLSSSVDACMRLKSAGYQLIGVEQTTESRTLQSFGPEFGTGFGLILGNEVDGIKQEVLNLCDYCVEIPQFGSKHSFNVSVCAGIVLWQMMLNYGSPKI